MERTRQGGGNLLEKNRKKESIRGAWMGEEGVSQ